VSGGEVKLVITVNAIVPEYTASEDASQVDIDLYNAKRRSETRKMIEVAIKSVLIKRGAWEPKIKVSVQE
jgi:hypothetical protein